MKTKQIIQNLNAITQNNSLKINEEKEVDKINKAMILIEKIKLDTAFMIINQYQKGLSHLN